MHTGNNYRPLSINKHIKVFEHASQIVLYYQGMNTDYV